MIINPFEAIPLVLSWKFMPAIVAGSIIGQFVGAMPGITSAGGVIIALPLTFFMDTDVALALLVSIYMGSLTGGGITAVYFNIPGDPQAALTAIDGFQMTKKGLYNEANGIVIGASFFGGLFSYIILALLLGPLGEIALKFGPIEMCLTALVGMICAAGVKGRSPLKGLASGFLGFILGTIGLGPTGGWRATFGFIDLMEGVPFIPVLIGMLAMVELLDMMKEETIVPIASGTRRSFRRIWKGMIYPLKKPVALTISSIIGTIVGIIPGEGATMASFLSYSRAKETSKERETYGTGNPVGVLAAESADNASSGGGLLTTLLLGIPGTATCALLMAALMLHGIQCGPMMLIKHKDVVSHLLTSLFVSNLVMVITGIGTVYCIGALLFTPTRVLVPIIMVFCVLGAYFERNSMFDVWVMFIFGLLAWLMRKYEYSPLALVVALIVAPIADHELIRAIQIHQDRIFSATLRSPVALILIGLNIALLIYMFRGWKKKVKEGEIPTPVI